jgi:uncharacterized protein with FMN-binding domain
MNRPRLAHAARRAALGGAAVSAALLVAACSGSSAASSNSSLSGTSTGASVATPYGNVQVKVTITSGKITDVVAVTYPTGHESDQINAQAIPILRLEALTAQGAKVNTVSGATWTSQGYTTSLQSALDQAGF